MGHEDTPVRMTDDPNVEYEVGIRYYIDGRLSGFVVVCICSFVLALLINVAILYWFPVSPKVIVYPVSEKTLKQLKLTPVCSAK